MLSKLNPLLAAGSKTLGLCNSAKIEALLLAEPHHQLVRKTALLRDGENLKVSISI